jgi:tripartite-type tricarboxylate transporter receptor subunit TctC
MKTILSIIAAAALTLAAHGARAADSAADFYKGKTIQLYIGYSPGGGYDEYARVLARHMVEHIPGHPNIVPHNMPGAGSLRSVNFLYNVAPKDGTAMATFARGEAMQPLLDPTGTQFDGRKFNWVGSITDETSVCAFMASTGIKDFADMRKKEFTVGGTGPGADTDIFSYIVRNIFHVRLKMITGYPGGNDLVLAMERGEIDGRCGWSWSSILSRSKNLLDEKKINITLQFDLEKNPELPHVPLILDLTKDKKELAAMKLIISRNVMARPFALPPGVPGPRVAALRAAFDATMKDPAFLAETKKARMEVHPVSGAKVEKLVEEVYASPPAVIELAKKSIKE